MAINPIDWKLQERLFFPLNYPTILGLDLAGEVVEVGSSVSLFSKGDRVLGHALIKSSSRESRKECESAFQLYTIVQGCLASKSPAACRSNKLVLPLCLSTAACGMFQKHFLALQYPLLNPKPTGKTLLVWGGATSVGSNAIQLGVAAGY